MSRSTSLATTVAASVLASAAFAQPGNDSCASAIPVANHSVTPFSTAGATLDGSTVLCSTSISTQRRDVWYSYTASGPERVLVSLCGSDPARARWLAAFADCGGAAIACNTQPWCSGGEPRLAFNTQGAGTYYIAVINRGSSGSEDGVIRLDATPGLLPNDDCSGAIAVADGDNPIDNTFATPDTQIACAIGGPASSGPDAWYSYTATATGLRTFEITSWGGPASFAGNTNLAIFDSCGGTLLACNDDNGLTQLSTIPHFHVVAGTTYFIRYATHPNWPTAPANLRISPASAVSFDDCELATPVSGSATVPFNTQGLTTDGTDYAGANDGWYSWTPAISGVGVVSTCGLTTGDTTLSAYAGCQGARLAGNNNYCGNQSLITFPVTAGTPVLVRIASLHGEAIAGQVSFNVVQPPPNDTCAGAQVLSGPGDYPFDSTYATTQGPSGSCNIGGATDSRDLFYSYTAGNEGTITVRTSHYLADSLDTNLQIFDACGGTELACSDNQTPGQLGEINARICQLPVTAGSTYIIRLATYDALTSGGVGLLTLQLGSAQYVPPAGAIPEPGNVCDEHRETDVNYGCNVADGTDHFTPIHLCDTYEGHSSYRPTGAGPDTFDFDAYQFTLNAPDTITVTGQTMFNAAVSISQGCSTSFATYGTVHSSISCDGVGDFSFIQPLRAGTYRLAITLDNIADQSVVCGSGNDLYWFHIAGSAPCPVLLCPADLGTQGGLPGADHVLDNNDFIAFINYFFAANALADMGVPGGIAGHDGQFDNNDFIAFINAFFAGCP